jgi:hypothetical protein
MSDPSPARRTGWDRDPRRSSVGRPDPRNAGRATVPARWDARPPARPGLVESPPVGTPPARAL